MKFTNNCAKKKKAVEDGRLWQVFVTPETLARLGSAPRFHSGLRVL